MTEWICRNGVPLQILSDQGRKFESELLQEICELLDMKKICTSRYRPQTDGLVERYNQTLKSMLRSFCNSKKLDWNNHLLYVMIAYWATVQASTRCTPNLFRFGQEIKLPVDMYGLVNESNVPNCPTEYVQWIHYSITNAFENVRETLKASTCTNLVIAMLNLIIL